MIDVRLCLIRLSSVNAVDETSDFLNFCCASSVKSNRIIYSFFLSGQLKSKKWLCWDKFCRILPPNFEQCVVNVSTG